MGNRMATNLCAGLVLGGALLLSGCGHPVGVTYVSTPPPPPIAEPAIISPGPGYVWVPGYQTWNGNRYLWVRGHWELRPVGMHQWIPGHWRHNGYGWYWVPGHWR
ncbi:MAG: hypothetical protein WAL32_10130 [Terriglobales bacterium]